jgi:hypothetical protein
LSASLRILLSLIPVRVIHSSFVSTIVSNTLFEEQSQEHRLQQRLLPVILFMVFEYFFQIMTFEKVKELKITKNYVNFFFKTYLMKIRNNKKTLTM